MTVRAAFASHEAYIAAMPAAVQAILLQVQARVEAALPVAVRCISYGMPAYRGDKKVFFYFAGFKQHLGIYPPVKQDPALMAELAPFRNEKGNLSFPYKHPIPYDLIVKVALCLAKEYALNAAVPSRGAIMPSEEKAKGPASYFPSIEKKYGQPAHQPLAEPRRRASGHEAHGKGGLAQVRAWLWPRACQCRRGACSGWQIDLSARLAPLGACACLGHRQLPAARGPEDQPAALGTGRGFPSRSMAT